MIEWHNLQVGWRSIGCDLSQEDAGTALWDHKACLQLQAMSLLWCRTAAFTSWWKSTPRGRQRKKSRTPRGEISWNQVEIMRNQSRFPWNQARKSAQPSSSTHFYNIWHHFWGKSWGNQREIRKSCTPKLLVADPSIHPHEHTSVQEDPSVNISLWT